jgi:curved DNA-binding protein
MKAVQKDYYWILGVPATATGEEIRKAYRRLARTHHPDVAENKLEAEAAFKDLNEANEVLGDPRRRRDYDLRRDVPRFDTDYFNRSAPRQSGFSSNSFRSAESQDFGFRSGDHFSGVRSENQQATGEGCRFDDVDEAEVGSADSGSPETEVDIVVSLEEMIRGCVRPLVVHRSVRCIHCQGRGFDKVGICPTCGGGRQTVSVDHYNVRIPAGARDGQRLRLSARGQAQNGSAEHGGLFLRVRAVRHPHFAVIDDDLHYNLTVSTWLAVLGTTVCIPHPSGRLVVRVPAGIQNGQKLRVRGRGMPEGQGKLGDLLILVTVQMA